jgi:AraC-like DNA-binding protein
MPIVLFAQVQKKDLKQLSYKELHNLYFDNENDKEKQLELAHAYLAKANAENSSIRKAKANYQFALLYYDTNANKAIMYLDSVIKYSLTSKDKYFPSAAYCEKADFLKRKYRFKEAMANYNLAEKIALKTNIEFYYNVRNYIGTTKSEDLGEYNEALIIYKECYEYYRSKDVRDPKYSTSYQNIIFGIADCYKSLNSTDSTSYYNRLGYHESTITKNEEYKHLFILNEGANQVLKKNYKAALDSINKALPKMIAHNNVGNILASYFYLGKAFDGLGNKTEAVKNFIKVDSIYKKTKEITTEFIDGYPYLINYYKKQGDRENQLKYITAYMTIDSTLQKNYKQWSKLISKEYDTPHLLSEKETLIQLLKKDKTQFYWGIATLVLLVILISLFGFYQHILKKRYKSRFEKIMNRENAPSNIVITPIPEAIVIATKNKEETDIGIAEELVSQILDKLNEFENENGYLESKLTIQMLSTAFDTNSKYVSKIINTFKGKTFIQYINDLRIEYAIIHLKKDTKLTNFTIQALAQEFGFNSAESFSNAFYKKTGIKPTYFIKKLVGFTETQNNN